MCPKILCKWDYCHLFLKALLILTELIWCSYSLILVILSLHILNPRDEQTNFPDSSASRKALKIASHAAMAQTAWTKAGQVQSLPYFRKWITSKARTPKAAYFISSLIASMVPEPISQYPAAPGSLRATTLASDAGWHGKTMAFFAKLRLKNFLIFFSFTVKRNTPFSFTGKIFF